MKRRDVSKMNESLFIRSESQGRPLKPWISRPGKDHLRWSPHASPEWAGLPAAAAELKVVQQRHDWRNQEFFLDVAADSAAQGFRLPRRAQRTAAPYITIEVESYKF